MLSEAMPVDAVYLDLHGAMVTEDFEDAEGELLRRVRAAVGRDVPIVVSLDYHANVTPEMVELTDGLVGYWTYPHVDRVETGQHAARVMRTLLERGRPRGPRAAQAAVPHSAQRAVHAGRTLEERGRAIARSATAICSTCPIWRAFRLRISLVRPGGDRACVDAGGGRSRRRRACSREIEAQEADFAAPMLTPEEGVARGDAHRAHAPRVRW